MAKQKCVLFELKVANAARCELAFGHTIKDWSLTDWGCALGGETGELLNFVKKQHRDGVPRTKAIAKEAADIVIYLDLLCQRAGIDLREAIRDKFNAVSVEKGVKIFI